MHFVQTTVDHWEVHINPVSRGPTETNICAPSCTRPRFTVQSFTGPVFSNHWLHPNIMLLISVGAALREFRLDAEMLSNPPDKGAVLGPKAFWTERSENNKVSYTVTFTVFVKLPCTPIQPSKKSLNNPNYPCDRKIIRCIWKVKGKFCSDLILFASKQSQLGCHRILFKWSMLSIICHHL